jgi:glycosyltransferase involved in cell wall biosynthesis
MTTGETETTSITRLAPPTNWDPNAQGTIGLVHIINAPFSLHFIAGQIGFMVERRFAIAVITSPGEHLKAFGEREGVAVYGLEMPRRITPLRDLLTLWRLQRYLRRVRPAIVHAHTPKGGLLGMIGAWLARVPVRVYHIRGLPFVTATGAQRLLLRATEYIACALADQVLCVSHSVRQVAVAERICPARKVKVLLGGSGNGVDSALRFDPAAWPGARTTIRERYSIPPSAFVIGFVGRLVRDKGLTQLLEAWSVLREEYSHVHLLVIGDFEPRDPVPARTQAAMRSDRRIHMVGWERNTPPFYVAMDLFVLPSHREGFSNVLLEASSMALPLVATRIPGCIDAIDDGVTGTLVPAGDAQSLAGAIRAYVSDADMCRRHGRAGREKVQREFRREAIWQAVCDEYQRLLREKGFVAGPVAEARSGAGQKAASQGATLHDSVSVASQYAHHERSVASSAPTNPGQAHGPPTASQGA